MLKTDYPALYQSTDAASIKSQSRYLCCIKVFSAFIIIGSGLGGYGIQSKELALIAAIFFMGGIFVSSLMAFQQYEKTWYRARAISESVKTGAWRFMTRAEPYENADSIELVKSNFRKLLKNILKEHKDLAHELGGEVSQEEQITDFMCEMRSKTLEERNFFYLDKRIIEQRSWYAKKSSLNKKWGLCCHILFIV